MQRTRQGLHPASGRPAAALLVLALAAAAQGAQAPKGKSLNELKAFYQQNCTRCHGADGSAKGPDGKRKGGVDFTVAAQGLRAQGGPPPEREVRSMSRVVLNGIFFGMSMPSWKDQLTPEEAALLVREVLLKAEPGKVIEPLPTGGGSR